MVAVCEGTPEAVAVDVGEEMTCVPVAVNRGVAETAVGVRVAVGVFVVDGRLVGAGVEVEDPLPSVTTNCGGVVPSREENSIPSLLSATRANE